MRYFQLRRVRVAVEVIEEEMLVKDLRMNTNAAKSLTKHKTARRPRWGRGDTRGTEKGGVGLQRALS